MTNVCGHERDALRWALRVQCLIDRGLPAMIHGMWTDQATALNDIIDPAKLAEMLAEEGRRLSVQIRAWTHPEYGIGWSVNNAEYGGFLESPHVRSILLRWIDLPDGAREEAERALRGSNADPTKLGP